MNRKNPIRILIVDESRIFQEGSGGVIQQEADMSLLGAAGSATILQLFTQGLTPINSAGNWTSTSATSRQNQFALKVLW
jgi:hypothetical protein